MWAYQRHHSNFVRSVIPLDAFGCNDGGSGDRVKVAVALPLRNVAGGLPVDWWGARSARALPMRGDAESSWGTVGRALRASRICGRWIANRVQSFRPAGGWLGIRPAAERGPMVSWFACGTLPEVKCGVDGECSPMV